MIQYHQDNPQRPPSWRWERAKLIREHKIKGNHQLKEDAWTRGAMKLQTGLHRCRDASDRYLLMERNPSLFYAWDIHRPAGEDSRGSPLRHAVEARLLAGESYQDVAEKLGCSAAVIEWYERVFFNVRDKLKNPDYVMTCVIGPAVHTGMTSQDYDVIWKLFGYVYGPLVLDTFVHGTTAIHHADSPEAVDVKLTEDVEATLRRKAAICARTYTMNNFTQEGLMNVYVRVQELKNKAGVGEEKDAILATLNNVLKTLPFADQLGTIRPDAVTRDSPPRLLKVDQPLLEHYDGLSTELRADELLAVASGKELPNRAQLEDMKFPEPRDAD